MCVRNFSVFFFFNFRDRNGRFLFGILTAKGVISQHRNPNKLEVISKTKAPPPTAHLWHWPMAFVLYLSPPCDHRAYVMSSLHLLQCYGLCIWPLVLLFWGRMALV